MGISASARSKFLMGLQRAHSGPLLCTVQLAIPELGDTEAGNFPHFDHHASCRDAGICGSCEFTYVINESTWD